MTKDLIEMTPIPARLSVDAAYPGFRVDALDVAYDLTILLDGVEQKNVIAYDIEAHRLVRVRLDAVGNIVPDGDRYAIDDLTGTVEVTRRTAE